MFDRVVCINLTRRQDRWAAFQKRLPRPWPFAAVERVAAIDGNKVPLPRWYGAPPPKSNHPPKPPWRALCRGAWGCLRSHVRVWEEALSEGHKKILILEDDAIFISDFSSRVQAFLDCVPDDWDQIYLGGQHLTTNQRPPRAFNEQVLVGRNVNRTHAYAISHHMMAAGYQRFHQIWQGARLEDWHIDYQLGDMHRSGEWAIYCPRKWLVGQAKGPSDVAPSRSPMSPVWWKEFPVC